MKQLKILLPLLLSMAFSSCSLEEDFVKKHNKISIQDIKMKHISYNDFNRKMQFVKNKPIFNGMVSENIYARTATDSSDYVIYTDRIAEITKDGYTSYTMLLKVPTSTNNLYYNIVFEVKNETVTPFIVKYTKSENGIFDEIITTYKTNGEFLSGGVNELQMYVEDFDNSGGGGSSGTPTSTTPGGMPWTGLGGSPVYPQNCDGTVTTTYVSVPYACASGNHMPGQSCEYLNPNHQLYNPNNGPYYELTPYYTCEPSPSGGNNNSPGNNNPGVGGTTPPEYEDTEITAMIQPEECTGPLEGDLDGDCMLSQYEMCLLNGYTQEVCNCVQENNGFEMCQEFMTIVEEVPDAKYIRYQELIQLTENNEWALIENCAQQNGINTADYIDLYNHTIPQSCKDRLDNLGSGYKNQPISEGNVPMANVDYYGVEITTKPDLNNDGQPDTNTQIYQTFREKFTEFASGEKSQFASSCNVPFDNDDLIDIWWEFNPMTNYDNNLFLSNNPISSIIIIDAGANNPFVDANADLGAIIVSGFTANNWTISTIQTPDTGTQPFSGNRQWGWIINQNGNLEIYTRAVDVARVADIFLEWPATWLGSNVECQQETYYDIAEATWQNMQQEIKQWVNSNGGQATVKTPKVARVKKEYLKTLLESIDPINQIISNCD